MSRELEIIQLRMLLAEGPATLGSLALRLPLPPEIGAYYGRIVFSKEKSTPKQFEEHIREGMKIITLGVRDMSGSYPLQVYLSTIKTGFSLTHLHLLGVFRRH